MSLKQKIPWGLIGWVLAAGLSVWLFILSTESKEITYYISQTFEVANPAETESLTVLDSDGNEVRFRVFASTITVWNSGDVPIEGNDLRNLTISVPSGDRILESKIIESTHPDLINLGGKKVNGSTINLSWDLLDERFGFKYKLIYENSTRSTVTPKFDGHIVGIDRFVDGNSTVLERRLPIFASNWAKYVFPFFLLILANIVISSSSPLSQITRLPRRLINWFGVIVLLLTFLYLFFFDYRTPPPF